MGFQDYLECPIDLNKIVNFVICPSDKDFFQTAAHFKLSYLEVN